jgi:hypothetical protein
MGRRAARRHLRSDERERPDAASRPPRKADVWRAKRSAVGLPASFRFAHRERGLVGVFFCGQSVLPFPPHLARGTTPYGLLQRHFEHLTRRVRSPKSIVDHTLHHSASAAAWTGFIVHQLAPYGLRNKSDDATSRTIASKVEVCGTGKKCPRVSEGARLHLLGGGKRHRYVFWCSASNMPTTERQQAIDFASPRRGSPEAA